MTEQEKMLRGMLYDPSDKTLSALREKAHALWQEYNLLAETDPQRAAIFDELCPHHGPDCFLAGPVYIDYGVFTSFGARVYANFNFTVLDTCPVTIGDDVMFGPNCSGSETSGGGPTAVSTILNTARPSSWSPTAGSPPT